LAQRKLLMAGQRVRLAEWPDRQAPLLQFEGSEMEQANRLLADQSVVSPGPVWLFRIKNPGQAVEVRGKFVRPEHSYIIVMRADVPADCRPCWLEAAPCATRGIVAYSFNAPRVMCDPDIEVLRSLGVGVVADVQVRPAGVVPGDWDGEGVAEWLAGEQIVLAIKE
jgi:hypothetical protein